ncbi:MAG: hypothetical protein IT290_12500, partial [Deltaproteobacteria bacterium]|nr:hypothetical protein [Deltaproteobacteria bacterium]
MTIGMVFTLIASVLVLAGELALGQAICGALMRRVGVEAHAEDHSPLAPLFWISFLVGLFAHLFGVLVIGGIVCGTDVGQAFAVEHSSFFWGVLACAPLCLSARRWVRDRTLVAWTPTPITVSWAVWLTVISALSMSLFDAIETLSTAWPFNYGDLPFHLGMITSFVYGGNLLPEYQIYAGKGLSYPFFVNLWSALLWFPDPSFESLDVVFAVQWIVLWCAVFGLLRGDRFYLLPWAVLLGGGSFEVLAKIMTHTDWNLSGVFGGKLIREQFPWEPLLPTIWVTQRSALIGVVTLLAAVRYFHQRFSSTGVARERIIGIVLPGVTLSLGMLAHTHLFLCAFMYLGLNVGFVVLQNVWGWCSRPAVVRERLTTIVAPLLWLGLSALPTLLSVPFIWDKRGTVRFVLGWMPWTVAPESGNLGALIGSVATW